MNTDVSELMDYIDKYVIAPMKRIKYLGFCKWLGVIGVRIISNKILSS